MTPYRHDAFGNRLSETRISDGRSSTIGYAYNGDDQLLRLTYPSGTVVHYRRDPIGQVETVEIAPLATGIRYRPFGPISGFQFGHGLTFARQFELGDRLTAQQTLPLHDWTYRLDDAGNIEAIEDGIDPARTRQCDYDALDRLTYAAGADGERHYRYDEVGNRLARARRPSTATRNRPTTG